MSTDLMQRFDELEQQRTELFARIGALDEEQLNRTPEDGGWSIIQVMAHLTTAEKLSLKGVKKAMEREVRPVGFLATVKKHFLRLALAQPLRIKAPPMAAEVPEHQDLETTRQEWDEVRAHWRQTLEDCPPELANRGIFRHPIVGFLNLAQGLDFLHKHVQRHGRQIDRLISELG